MTSTLLTGSGQLPHPGPGPDFGEVAELTRKAPSDLTNGPPGSARRSRWTDATGRRDYFHNECWNAWRDFGQQPGTHLWSERTGWRRELRTAEQQTIASLRGFTWQNRGYGQGQAVTVGGQSFTFKTGKAVRSSPPGISEIAAAAPGTQQGTSPRKGQAAGSGRPKPAAKNLAITTPQRYLGHSSMRRERLSCMPAARTTSTGRTLASRSPISDGSDFWSGERDRAMQS